VLDHPEPKGFFSRYVFSLDHKVIGIQYIVGAILMGLVAAYLSLLIRSQLAWKSGIRLPEDYIAVVTMHGTLMVFFVVSPLLSGLGNFLIPLHIGARDMAYPFLNMLSFWTYALASIVMIASFFVPGGAAASGWTAYPPLSGHESFVPGSGWGQTFWLLGMALFIASFTMGGLNFLTTILNMRTTGMTMFRMPLTVWGFLVATILGLLAFPPLTAAALMLLVDRHGGTSFFLVDSIVGGQLLELGDGTPLLFQHLFWFFGHPEVYVIVLPCVCMLFDIMAAFTRRPAFGYRPSVWALLAVGFLSMIVWGHHMFVTGMNPWVGKYFSIATVLITAPFAVLGVNLVASLWRARVKLATPMLLALATISTIGFGGVGGLFLGTMTSDIYFHETYFVVGHFHLMIGTVTLLSILAALYYWFPKMFGRMMSEKLGKAHFWLTAPPMMTVFILMHMQGLGGMVRRTYDTGEYQYNEGANTALSAPISILAMIAVGAQVLFLGNFFWSALRGRKAERNPWDATTLEWETPSPAPHGNFGETLPVVRRGPYEYSPEEVEADYLPQAAEEPRAAAGGASA